MLSASDVACKTLARRRRRVRPTQRIWRIRGRQMLKQTGGRQQRPGWIRVVTAGAAVGAVALLMAAVALAGSTGTITALSATDAPNPGQTVAISASFLASAKITNSNVYYELIAPDGVTVVATHSTSVPGLQVGDTFNDSWTTTNTSFP